MWGTKTKSETKSVSVLEPVNTTRSTNQLIEEIHETFFTEVDRLLASAKQSNSLETDKQGLIDKHKRLMQLGFTNSKEVKEAQKEIIRLEKLKAENAKKQDLIEAINYFSVKYPTYKFITQDSVLKICKKYGLVYGEISRYLGEVPEKNLKHIENFKVQPDDECYVREEWYNGGYTSKRLVDREYYKKSTKAKSKPNSEEELYMRMRANDYHYEKVNMQCPLEIAAPQKDFDMDGMEIKDFKLTSKPVQVPDPVVLKPVIFNQEKYYLIITAWGQEASDEIVVNQLNN